MTWGTKEDQYEKHNVRSLLLYKSIILVTLSTTKHPSQSNFHWYRWILNLPLCILNGHLPSADFWCTCTDCPPQWSHSYISNKLRSLQSLNVCMCVCVCQRETDQEKKKSDWRTQFSLQEIELMWTSFCMVMSAVARPVLREFMTGGEPHAGPQRGLIENQLYVNWVIRSAWEDPIMCDHRTLSAWRVCPVSYHTLSSPIHILEY